MTLKAEFLQTSKVTLYVWTHIMFLHDFIYNYFSLIAACAAARRAIGTRNGEQET